MSLEIELKAHLDDPEGLKKVLEAQNLEAKVVSKKDIYFTTPTKKRSGNTIFRLRIDRDLAVLTTKIKRNNNGIEVNRELECDLTNPDNFIAMTELWGFVEAYRKTKSGWAFSMGSFLIEIVEVAPAGWFVEIETIIEDEDDSKKINQAQKDLKELLIHLGISASKLESKPYAQLLGFKNPSRQVKS